IEKRGRERMQAALPSASLTQAMMMLARSRGIGQAHPPWEIISERDGGRQSERSAQYQCAVSARDGLPAFTAEARLILPDGFQHQSVEASAGLRIRLATVDAPAGGTIVPRLSVTELVDTFLGEWETATQAILLALAEDPIALPLAGPPRAELYVNAVQKYVD